MNCTMMKYAAVFALFSGVFGVMGCREAARRQEAPDYVKLFVVSQLVVMDHEGRPALVFASEGKPIWWLDLDVDRGAFLDPSAILDARRAALPGAIPVGADALEGFLGGVGAWKFKDVLTVVQKGEARQQNVIAAIAGAASGYSAGYWLRSRFRLGAKSASVTALLSDPQQYDDIQRLAFMLLVKTKSEGLVQSIQSKFNGNDAGTRAEVQALQQTLINSRDPAYDFVSADFRYFLYTQ
jgi:hypothetical protein